jgi:hypothetical protein
MRFMTVVLATVLLPCLLVAQPEEKDDTWAPLRPLIGEWVGTGAGGVSKVEARYRFVLNETYIEARHRAEVSPTEENPAGEVHEDRGFMSYDRDRENFVYRQFHGEGFVNQYVLDSLSSDGSVLVFVSEAVENAPAGTRAKWELTFSGEDNLATSFHVAWPQRDFQRYSENTLKRRTD